MSLDPSTFETVVPSRYITFTLPHPHRRLLRVAVLDSPSASAAAPSPTAAMWVPPGRESDWIFSTFSGHLQLLLSSPISRLILLGNCPSYPQPTSYNSALCPSSPPSLQQNIAPLLLGLTPKSEFVGHGEIPEVPLLVYEDEVVKNSILEICEGPCVGEMLIENVELVNDGVREFRRRLRFKRMPNFVQSQMRIRPVNESSSDNLDDSEFELDKGVLVQPYLSPMVAGIAVISWFLEGRMRAGFRPKALCLGVGGGALLGFLSNQLNFEVDGIEEDEAVLDVAKRYFGLDSDEFIHLFAEDGIGYVKRIANNISEGDKFDIVMVDLDSSDVMNGVCAPPVEFVEKYVLRAVRAVLCEEGILVINVIPSSELFYERLICEFQEVFEELYEIDVGNGENFVLIATQSIIRNALDGNGSAFLNKLKMVSVYDLVTADLVQNTRLLVSLNTSSCSPGNGKCGQSIRYCLARVYNVGRCVLAKLEIICAVTIAPVQTAALCDSVVANQGFRLLTAARYEDEMEKSTAYKSFCTNNTNEISPEAYLND
ncbi:S-adenosyl-L-methionine-dependent methyltransferases superfamily protein [Perilla frutescens var. hirtella]|uniref:S-adenosyl-L-methionine-dependent methyltransferases superfamily protein n=1 Tax=Perilla frutescens var. hirtella TaxID=608512 RepID=A0AAD4J9E8_PERFH|nr:S-adenosyl-L-methionine-dependent methyltransferases superfamily protein [Perilla frutescens var. hirtella]